MSDPSHNAGTVARAIAFVRESLRDNDVDYTKEPVPRALGLLAIPMMLDMVTEAILAVVDIAFALAARITAAFSSDPGVLRYGTSCPGIPGVGYPACALGMVMSQAINGAGDTMTPTTLNLVAFWLVQIPLACWLAEGVGLGPDGVFTAIVVGESLLTILAVLVFRRGHWKTVAA